MLPALAQQTREPDPVFWLAGGPGGAATESAHAAAQLMSLVNQQRDIVLVDQRGTGGSSDLRCPQGTVLRRWAEELRTCLSQLGGDPRAYTTAWAMDDVDDVRAALGYDRINLYGISYGATAAQVYVQRHADRARTAILESGTVLGVPILERFPAAAQRALDLLFARCAADAACSKAFPDPAADLRAVTARLERGPVDLPVSDPSTGKAVRYTRHDMAAGLLEALSNLRTALVLPRQLHAAARGNWQEVLAAAQASSAESARPGWQLMALTIDCYEPEERVRRSETEAHAVGSFLTAQDMLTLVNPDDVCGVMPAPSAGMVHHTATTESVPMLFINGNADPKDLPVNVATAPRVNPHSLTITVRDEAHDYNVDASCRAGLFAAFIRTASTGDLPSQCLQEQWVPAFDLG